MMGPAHRPAVTGSSWKRQCGAAAIEFGITITVLLLLLLGVIGYGALSWAQQQLSAAAGEGARAGLQARYAGLADVQAAACDRAVSVFGPGPAVQCNRTAPQEACDWLDAAGKQVPCIKVELRYDVTQWPLLESFQDIVRLVTRGGVERLIPSTLSARAKIQIPQEPL